VSENGGSVDVRTLAPGCGLVRRRSTLQALRAGPSGGAERPRPPGRGGGVAAVRGEGRLEDVEAVSTGGCNGLGEDLRWCHPPEGLSRPPVELTGDSIEVGLRVHTEVTSFGEVLSQQSFGVLVAAALPRAVWIAEIDDDSGVDAETHVLAH
jgi:hypothetical protein